MPATMEASGAAAPQGPGVLPILDLPPGLITESIVPRLRPHQQAALALTCRHLRRAVHDAVRALALPGGRCCPAVRASLQHTFPGVQAVTLTPSNLHEAMNVLPSLLMTMGKEMANLSRVVLHDKLPDEPSERRKCTSCNAWCNTYDLAAIVFTVHGCLASRLRSFDFATHYISNAECMAIGNMTALTSLRCASPHGFSAGGLGALSCLTRLRRLEVTDAPRSWTEGDVEAVAGMAQLTRLALGGGTGMLRVLLRRIADARGCPEPEQPPGPAGAGGRGGAVAGMVPPLPLQQQIMHHNQQLVQPQQHGPQPRRGGGGSTDGGGGSCGGAVSDLQLLELEVTFDWLHASNADLLPPIARLTTLTSLTIGWLGQSTHSSSAARRTPLRSCSLLSALSTLRSLSDLSVGWPIDHDIFNALATLPALTAVTLGTLPLPPAALAGAPPPPPPAPPVAQLPRVQRLSVASVRWLASRHPWHELSQDRQRLMGLDGTYTAAWISALPAFPGLTQLVLDTGAARAESLARLPAVAPGLRELLLPPRLAAGSGGAADGGGAAAGAAAAAAADGGNGGSSGEMVDALHSLGTGLTALTQLRIGWKAALDEGPPLPLLPAVSGDAEAAPAKRALTLEAVFCPAGAAAAAGVDGDGAAAAPGKEQGASTSAAAAQGLTRRGSKRGAGGGSSSGSGAAPAAAASAAAAPAGEGASSGRRMRLRSQGSAEVSEAAGPGPSSLAASPDAAAEPPPAKARRVSARSTPRGAAGAGPSTAASGPSSHPQRGRAAPTTVAATATLAVPAAPLFPALRSLEVSGPAHIGQIAALHALPSHVTELIISDNPSWSSGLGHSALLSAARAPGLQRLGVRRCRGLDGRALEAALLRASTAGAPPQAPAAAAAAAAAGGGGGDVGRMTLPLDFDYEPLPLSVWQHADRGGVFPLIMGPVGPAGLAAGPPGGGGWLLHPALGGGGGGGGPMALDDEGDWVFQLPGLPPLPPAGGPGGGAGGAAALAAQAAAALQQQAAALQQQAQAAQQQLANLQEQLGLPALVPPGLIIPPPGLPGLAAAAAGAANMAAANAAANMLAAALAPQPLGGDGDGGGGGGDDGPPPGLVLDPEEAIPFELGAPPGVEEDEDEEGEGEGGGGGMWDMLAADA